jgi:Beta-lactamase
MPIENAQVLLRTRQLVDWRDVHRLAARNPQRPGPGDWLRAGRRWLGAEHRHPPLEGTAAGGGYSTVGDLLRFAQALSSGTLISTATLAEMTRPHQQGYGYGFAIGQDPVPNDGHSGGAPGMNGDLRPWRTFSRSVCPTNSRPTVAAQRQPSIAVLLSSAVACRSALAAITRAP